MTVGEWMRPRTLELIYTADDLRPLAHDLGYGGAPFRWDDGHRFELCCGLDAAFFHLYGIAADDIAYIMDTFPIVRANDEKEYGTYRTKSTVLAAYEALAGVGKTHVHASPPSIGGTA